MWYIVQKGQIILINKNKLFLFIIRMKYHIGNFFLSIKYNVYKTNSLEMKLGHFLRKWLKSVIHEATF